MRRVYVDWSDILAAMATLADVIEIGTRFPEAVPGDRGVGVLVKGKVKGFAWTWMERVELKKPRVENLGVVAISTPGLQAKKMLLETGEPYFFDEPHYENYPAILVKLDLIDLDALEDLLTEAWCTKAPPKLVKEWRESNPNGLA